MHNNISINYKIMTVFASDIAIYRRMSHDEYYDCRSEQTTCLKEDLSDYEGYLYIDNKKIPYTDRFMYRPPKVRPKNLTIGGRYFYG